MASENTPLLTTVRIAQPRRRRYKHNIVRRFCTVALSSTLVWLFLAFTISFITYPHGGVPRQHHEHWSWPGWKGRNVTYERLREILLEIPSTTNIEEWSRYYTSGPHLAGKNYSQAAWTRDRWEKFGIKSDIIAYDSYLNYPVDHRLALLGKEEGEPSWKVAFEASLAEDVIDEDPTTALDDRVPTFHGYSASGNVTARVVYVNYGTYQDYEDLINANVSLSGKIAIARYGGIFRGLKVKRAQELGMVGVILYTDPGDDGDITEENGVAAYPDGPARQPSSVQRGSTQFLSFAPGDPTTPGYPSKPGVPRQPVDKATPSIPSIPISYVDALPILQALNGHGPKAADFNQYWTRNMGLRYKGVEYHIGPTPDNVVVNLYNEQEYVITPIWNVIGVINGTISDEVLIVGNHRDAWIAGGAGDPNSGSAVLNEIVRGFGKALHDGWKPLRTIIFASWDGEEYGLVGSTEWVEEYLPWIKHANVAYLNVDTGSSGPIFETAASPLLNNVIYSAAASVLSPNQTIPGQTVFDLWDQRIKTMGSGSDFTAFQDFAGIPSIHVEFSGSAETAVYHYHSNYDSFHWMQNFGDPGFKYHRALTQVVGLMTAQLADLPLISFRAKDYTHALRDYVKKVEKKFDESISSSITMDVSTMSEEAIVEQRGSRRSGLTHKTTSPSEEALSFKKHLEKLHKALDKLNRSAMELDFRAAELRERIRLHIPWWKWPAWLGLALEIRKVNTRYKYIERSFLYDEGLDGRPWFKHVVFAPGLWTGYAGGTFSPFRFQRDISVV